MEADNTSSFNAGLKNRKKNSTFKKGRKLHQCPVCDEKFSNKALLFDHRIVHDKSLAKFTCQICDKGFYWKSWLKRHGEQHKESLKHQYKCGICDKIYKSVQVLNQHKIKHDKSLARYSCEVCGKGFFYECSLTSHMKKHDGYYVCMVCKKTFASPLALNNHTNGKHTKKLVFSCQICVKSYPSKYSLKQHEKSVKHLKKIEARVVEPLPREELVFVQLTTQLEEVKIVESISSIDNGYCSHDSERFVNL